MSVATAPGSAGIRPRSGAPGRAGDRHLRASPARALQTSRQGGLTAAPAQLLPITGRPPSPHQPLHGRSPRPGRLGAAPPMPSGGAPSAPAPRLPVRTTPGSSVPPHRVSRCGGPHASPGVSGGSLGRRQTRPARRRAVLAHANPPPRLLPPHDAAAGAASTAPCTARPDGSLRRRLRHRLVSPLGGLRVRRSRRGSARLSTPERPECHLHGDAVRHEPLIAAP